MLYLDANATESPRPAATEAAIAAMRAAGNLPSSCSTSGARPLPLRRTMPTAPRPGAVAMAAMGWACWVNMAANESMEELRAL